MVPTVLLYGHNKCVYCARMTSERGWEYMLTAVYILYMVQNASSVIFTCAITAAVFQHTQDNTHDGI
jgi:hypothetical protein